ncbi:MAG: D,D-dipeptide ABC transporter permease [Deltaproteobacteria bacterium]|nr:ABC transporter permease [Candidatus Bathyarchaeota archaeon]RJS90290.1 MAG: ABC transporter permease [Candidatus Bathyarchaeota archaeon]RLA85772.1 MAG: D,D-dipeptide ABC transporter permease [Deltaproteobacteria bacterium]
MKSIGSLLSEDQRESLKRNWHKFSTNPLSIVGLITVLTITFMAIFSPWIAPYPQSWGRWIDFSQASLPPSWKHPCGTDIYGRDILSRIMFGFRYDLLMAVCILAMVVPSGTFLGLVAGYYHGTWIDTVIMRITDIFLAIPSLVLALAICALLEPSLFNSMMAVSLLWWPWYSRLAYSLTSSIRNEYFVQAAELIGANPLYIMFREILPNCLSPIFTKMTLDVGWVILIGSTLSFVGLGAQEPMPALGNMVAVGSKYMPDYWWMTIFPALAIAFTILGFNLLGDGIRDLLAVEEI